MELNNFTIAVILLLVLFGLVSYFGTKYQDHNHDKK